MTGGELSLSCVLSELEGSWAVRCIWGGAFAWNAWGIRGGPAYIYLRHSHESLAVQNPKKRPMHKTKETYVLDKRDLCIRHKRVFYTLFLRHSHESLAVLITVCPPPPTRIIMCLHASIRLCMYVRVRERLCTDMPIVYHMYVYIIAPRTTNLCV